MTSVTNARLSRRKTRGRTLKGLKDFRMRGSNQLDRRFKNRWKDRYFSARDLEKKPRKESAKNYKVQNLGEK